MQKKAAVLSVILCGAFMLAPAGASANSGPAYVEQGPSFSVTPLKDCPITVEKEDLSFDFSGNKYVYSPTAAISAVYRMKNPTAQPQKVQMAFPLIARLRNMILKSNGEPSDVSAIPSITADGQKIPFAIYPGDTIGAPAYTHPGGTAYYSSGGDLNRTLLPGFESILKSIGTKKAVRNKLADTGELFRIFADRACSIQIKAGNSKTYLVGQNINGASSDGTSVTLDGWVHPPKDSAASVLVFGPPEITFGAFTNGGKPDNSAKLTKQRSTVSTDSFFEEMLSGRYSPSTEYEKALLKNMVPLAENYAEKYFSEGNRAFMESSLYDFLDRDRLFVLTYEVEFPAGKEKTVAVSYSMNGMMDSLKTAAPLYTYGYLLNPAKGWASFRDLDIRIMPPEKAPYLVNSSLPLQRNEKGFYTASLASLPEKDLTFSLYEKEKTEPKTFRQTNPWVDPLLGFVLPVALLILVFHFLRKQMKADFKNGESK